MKLKKIIPAITLFILLLCCGISANAATTVSSGSCGAYLTYVLDSDGVLTISGSGVMSNYTYNTAPWYSQRATIKKIIISDGVTFIGEYAFYDCDSITEIEIPTSVSCIYHQALSFCDSLSNVTFKKSCTVWDAYLEDLNNKGIKWMLSNVFRNNGIDNPILREWVKIMQSKYKNIHLYYLNAEYTHANFRRKNKGRTVEVLITNY